MHAAAHWCINSLVVDKNRGKNRQGDTLGKSMHSILFSKLYLVSKDYTVAWGFCGTEENGYSGQALLA